jgi:hypothetical protein
MSLDVLSEPGEDSNAEGGDGGSVGTGTGAGTATGTGTGEKKRRRRRKVEDYDRTDDFIDDTEMAWEEQALMAKDGFFVYSGPLVVEGEKVAVERYVFLFPELVVGLLMLWTGLMVLSSVDVGVGEVEHHAASHLDAVLVVVEGALEVVRRYVSLASPKLTGR